MKLMYISDREPVLNRYKLEMFLLKGLLHLGKSYQVHKDIKKFNREVSTFAVYFRFIWWSYTTMKVYAYINGVGNTYIFTVSGRFN